MIYVAYENFCYNENCHLDVSLKFEENYKCRAEMKTSKGIPIATAFAISKDKSERKLRKFPIKIEGCSHKFMYDLEDKSVKYLDGAGVDGKVHIGMIAHPMICEILCHRKKLKIIDAEYFETVDFGEECHINTSGRYCFMRASGKVCKLYAE